jgi:enoyl-CoA hydratase/carnithine racemase
MNTVRFETSGALGILSLANPLLNLFSGELIEDLRATVTQIKRAPLRALLVRADGKIFSGGADVSVFEGRTAIKARERFTSHLPLIADLEELPFPTVAAVQGMCIAAGFELALACDLIWAAASASFGQAEASIGTTTLLGGVQRLAERAGPARAREIIYTADQYDAATFERWNIVNRVVPDEVFESQVRTFAERLASGPTWLTPLVSGLCEPISTAVFALRTGSSTRRRRRYSTAKTCVPEWQASSSMGSATFATRSFFTDAEAGGTPCHPNACATSVPVSRSTP